MLNVNTQFHTALMFLLLCCCVPAGAEGLSNLVDDYRIVTAGGKASTRIEIDNDSLLLNRDDGLYTSGGRVVRQHALHGDGRMTVFGWRIGQQLYSSYNINLTPDMIGPPDHPYAAWLYGGFFKETYRADGTHLNFGLDFGCLGPCAGGEWTQTNLHRLLRQPLPRGWAKQVRNEWGMILHADMAPVRWQLAPWLDATPNLHVRFGNIHTDAGGGLTLRAGRLPQLPDQAGFYGLLRADVTAVAYNATLQGGYFSSNNPHTVKPKRWTGEAELGIGWSDGPYALKASVIRRANEIQHMPNSLGAQNFVRLMFAYSP